MLRHFGGQRKRPLRAAGRAAVLAPLRPGAGDCGRAGRAGDSPYRHVYPRGTDRALQPAESGRKHLMTEHTTCGLCRIELDDLCVQQGGKRLLTDVSMHIHCGQLTALIGHNGAGKTTLLRALLGQVPYTGRIAHLDHDARSIPHVRIGYVPQQLRFDQSMPITVADFLSAALTKRPVWTGLGKREKEMVTQALSQVDAQGLAGTPLGRLSGGELQR
ncbi:MAG: ATP-binding cassette domain-containing protein, partial [Clostridia bacterium]|nr:ATP-binding cassette domain-containing protein [Clostridia bacterium]